MTRRMILLSCAGLSLLATSPSLAASLDQEADRATVAGLDLAYQAAVKRNDAEAMDAILHVNFALVLGNGTVVTREALLAEARGRHTVYEIQDEDAGTQVVRVWGDTAVVTARLFIKGTRDEQPFERRLWFSDTYVRTAAGWKYAFAQASLPLPAERIIAQ